MSVFLLKVTNYARSNRHPFHYAGHQHQQTQLVRFHDAASILIKLKPPSRVVLSLASPARFERAAFRLGGERSILLSYGDKCEILVCRRHTARGIIPKPRRDCQPRRRRNRRSARRPAPAPARRYSHAANGQTPRGLHSAH